MKIYQAHPKDPCGWLPYYQYQFAIQVSEVTTVKGKQGYDSRTSVTSFIAGFKWEQK